MRDHLPCGVVQGLVDTADPDTIYTNGYLAEYAQYLSKKLKETDVPEITDLSGSWISTPKDCDR